MIMRALGRIDASAPQLKLYGFSLWVAWSFSGYSGFGWSNAAPMGEHGSYGVYFASTISLIAVTLAFVVANREASNHLLHSAAFVVACGAVASIGTWFLYLFGRSALDIPALYLAGSALTGAGSSVLHLKTGQIFGTLPPKRILLSFCSCAIVALLVYFVLTGVPEPLSIGIYIVLFFFSGCLLSLDNCTEKPQASNPTEYLDIPRSIWRLFLVIAIAMLLCATEVTYYSKIADIGTVAFADAYTSACSLIAFCALASVVLAAKSLPHFQDAFHPLALGFVIVFSVPLALENAITISVVVTGICKFSLIVLVPALWAYICFRSKTSPTKIFGLGNIWISLSDLFGRAAGIKLAETALPEYSYRIFAVLVIVLVFFSVLEIVLSKRRLGAIIAPIADENDESVVPANALDPKRADDVDVRQRRCEAISDRFGFSTREREVFYLLARGYGSNYISEKLTISYYTARAHTRNIYAKAGVHSRQELIALVDDESENGRG